MVKTMTDYFHISHSMAKKYKFHPLYPTRDDYVQNSMEQLLKSEKARQFGCKSIQYSHMNTHRRQFIKESTDIKYDIDDMRNLSSDRPNLINKLEIKTFMEWLSPKYKQFFEDVLTGMTMTEIGKKYNLSRQNMHVKKSRVIKKYQKHINEN